MNYEELIGYWYLSSNKQNHIFGSLKIYDDSKAVLSLCGTFDEEDHIFDFKARNIEIINGFTENGKKITLVDNITYGNSVSMPGMTTQEYEPSFVLIGEEFENKEDICFKSIKAKYTDLDKWLNEFNLKLYYKGKLANVKTEFEGDFEVTYNINGRKIKIGILPFMNWNKYSKFQLTQEAYLEFSKDNGYKIDDLFMDINMFSDFLSLCIGENAGIYSINAKDNKDNNIIIIHQQCRSIEKNTDRKINEILIPYSCIKGCFNECLKNWFNKSDKLAPIINFYIEAMEKVFHIPMTFIKLVQALEAFSRRMRNNCKINQEEYNNRISNIINCIKKEEDKEWLKGELMYSNEPNLFNRLKNLFKEVDFLFKLNSKERDKIANKITMTRNYYTHFDEKNKERIMNTDELFYVSQYLMLTLRVLIMKELGINEDMIKLQFDNTNDYKYSLAKCKDLFGIKSK